MTEAFQPLYPPRTGPLEPGESEAYDIVAHLNALALSGGSLLDGENNDQETDPPPTLEQLEAEYGTADDPDAWTGPTEAELPALIASMKRFARLDDVEKECSE